MTKVIGESKNTAARWHLLTGAVVFCALMVAGLGGMTLVGWLAEIDDLASFGTDKIPMAPSTALFFLLYGVMILLQVSPPAADRRRVLMSLPALPVTAVAVALLISSSLDRHFTIEHLGLDITGTLNGMPLGHMSPLTAFSFLLAGAALLSLVVGRAGRRLLPFLVAFALASLLSLLGLALLLAYLLGSPIFYGSGLIPPALPTALAFFLLAFCLQGLALPGLWQFALWSRFHPSYYALLLIFVILIGGIMVVGFVSFRHEEQEHRSAMSRQLTAVADLKTEMIAAWLRERDSHGWELMSNQGFAERVEQWLRHDSAVDRHIIMTRLESHFANYDYDGIVLYDPELRRQYGLGDCQELDPVMVATIEQAAQSRQVERSDLYRCPAGFVRMHWVVPILDLADGRLLAFVVRHVQVQSFLQPLLAGWAGSGRSSETLLVRREGEAVMFLGGRWLAEEQFLALRLGLDRTEVPAVQAVLDHEGLTEGRDYRGVPVMAAVKPVPGSSWYLVARIDLAEVYGPLGGILWAIVVLVLFLLLGGGRRHFPALAPPVERPWLCPAGPGGSAGPAD
ncbi:cache domain-containing protein [Desulfurivibrio dismutans]|uniref:cache domain-containing protein n=1 Tax=Desulfurivibrio dismutans TaxID=1398908 RepID=UPI0023DB9C88|nr:cache domain-containing protein [Desulfurivibrio alkaliphilus]MDF1614520.1 cache domain-containing protein [Desulfurivibrio alkaliphilus]